MASWCGLSRSCDSGGIVFRYGVVALYGTAAPFRRASLDHLIQQEERAIRALVRQHGVQRLQPLAGLGRVKIFQHQHPLRSNPKSQSGLCKA